MKPHLQTTIWTLLKGGATQREIERITGISRHTIRSYQQRFAADPANCPGVATDSSSQTAPPRPPTDLPVSPPVGDATMTTTILDRLMHRCAMLEFEGKSYRLKEAASRIAITPTSS
ncbi:hypothetical protein ASE11_24405 [Hydrogenophaga sp. Root209]|nr:hypothetical protein ASE11_24405 [Hydrogenophaga sp. Root209]